MTTIPGPDDAKTDSSNTSTTAMSDYRALAIEFASALLKTCFVRIHTGDDYIDVCQRCNRNLTYFKHKDGCVSGKAVDFLKHEEAGGNEPLRGQLIRFLGLVRQMRQAQRLYRIHRNGDALSTQMRLELLVDEALILLKEDEHLN